MKQSTNYGFNIPEGNDYPNIEVIGQAIEQIDEETYKKVEKQEGYGLVKLTKDSSSKYDILQFNYDGDDMYTTTIPRVLSELPDNVGYLKITDVKDYVIEQGTVSAGDYCEFMTGTWFYRKYNSGVLELFANDFNCALLIENATFSEDYQSNSLGLNSFAWNLAFTDIPYLTGFYYGSATSSMSATIYDSVLQLDSKNVMVKVITFEDWKSRTTIPIGLHLIGRWK